jgi:transcription termination factor Rho
MRRLRHTFASMDPQQSIGILLDRLRKTGSNAELLMHLARS